jgi:tRNA G18 (ribose-2'-O)-methylase SpoU
MLKVQSIEDFAHPALRPYRTMKQQRDHFQQRIFVAEGEKIVRRLLETNFIVHSLLLPSKWRAEFEPLLERRPELVDLFIADKDILEKLTGFSMYQGVLAVARIPDPVPLDAILAECPSPRLLVAADGLNNAENLGVMVRNCAAFGAQALLLGETSISPYMRRAVRTSMGNIFKLPVVECARLAWSIRSLREVGIRSVAAHPHTDQRTLSQAQLKGDCCLIFGNEGNGVSPEVLAVCDEAVAVPMAPGVDSLNVGNAAAVFLYEALRQRGGA